MNGHVFQVRGAAGQHMLAHLGGRDGVEVNRLCRGADGGSGDYPLALLRRLYSLRGVELAPDGS